MDYLKKIAFLKRYSKFQHRTKLIYFLSALQVVIALVLLNWLVVPKMGNYLKAESKGYIAQNFKPNIRYVLAKSDFVGGNATPSGFVKVILKEPKIVLRAKATPKGEWLVRIPEKIPEKAYQMQVITFDSKGKNPSVKQVKIKVESNNLIYRSKAYKSIKSWSKRVFSI